MDSFHSTSSPPSPKNLPTPVRMQLSLIPIIVCLLAISAPYSPSACAAPSPSTGSAESSVATAPAAAAGTLEGVIRYEPDPQRPWRLARYYVHNDGLLAEAVVALEGPGLADAASPAPRTSQTLDQIHFQFVPETLAIRAGQSVRITNSDDALHNVMTADGEQPFNINVVKGKEFSQTFARAGGLEKPLRLSCVYHGGMRAWIYVFDHPWFKVTQQDGRFRFAGVPAGRYNLGSVHPAGKWRSSRSVEVRPNATTSVEILLPSGQ